MLLLTAQGLAFLCLMFVVLANYIHPVPDRVTKQQDAAELARIEAQTLDDNARSAMPGPARVSNIDARLRPETHSHRWEGRNSIRF